MGEVAITALLCGLLSGGETEIRHEFSSLGETRSVRIDCETPTHVVEVGLDNTASNRDSVHQALFFAALTGKRPMVVLIDTDGREGRYEYEMRIVTQRIGIPYGVCRRGFIERWAATAPFRIVGSDKSLNDLPRNASVATYCDLKGEFEVPDLGQ